MMPFSAPMNVSVKVFPGSDSIKEHHWILFRIAEHRIPIKYANLVPRGPLSYARVVFFQPTYTPLHIVKHNTHPDEQIKT